MKSSWRSWTLVICTNIRQDKKRLEEEFQPIIDEFCFTNCQNLEELEIKSNFYKCKAAKTMKNLKSFKLEGQGMSGDEIIDICRENKSGCLVVKIPGEKEGIDLEAVRKLRSELVDCKIEALVYVNDSLSRTL